MHIFQRLCFASLAKDLRRFPRRLYSTGGRPTAPLGTRILTSPEDTYKHNMWDHVKWTEKERQNACQKAKENSCVKIPLEEQGTYDTEAYQYWDRFYELHQDKFFKDRKWLFLEFPELLPLRPENIATEGCQGGPQTSCLQPSGSGRGTEAVYNQHNIPTESQSSSYRDDEEGGAIRKTSYPGQHATFRILEVGCGVGNSVFPIVSSIKHTGAFLYCCDFSPQAIQLVKNHPEYDESVCHAFVHDICEEIASFPFPPQSLDAILMVFVLSSIHPERMQGVVNRLSRYLKHGGTFLFRDYGRYDISQLRFKKGQCLSENFYTRRDGTCVYFFTKDEVHSLFSNAGLEQTQNLEDRKLQVNRRKKVLMHRVWIQSKYEKLHPPASC